MNSGSSSSTVGADGRRVGEALLTGIRRLPCHVAQDGQVLAIYGFVYCARRSLFLARNRSFLWINNLFKICESWIIRAYSNDPCCRVRARRQRVWWSEPRLHPPFGVADGWRSSSSNCLRLWRREFLLQQIWSPPFLSPFICCIVYNWIKVYLFIHSSFIENRSVITNCCWLQLFSSF